MNVGALSGPVAALSMTLVAGAAAEPASGDTSSSPPAAAASSLSPDPLIETLRQTREALRAAGLADSPLDLAEILLNAFVRAVDPDGVVRRIGDWPAFERRQRGEAFGLGVEVVETNRQTVVVGVWPGSPAEGRLQPGDVFDRIGDRYVTGIPWSTQQHWIARATTGVEVVVMRPGRREPIAQQMRPAWCRPPAVAGLEVMPGGLQWLRLNGVWSGAVEAVSAALQAPATGRTAGLVLDLRAAGGDDLAAAAALAGLWSPSPDIIQRKAEGTRQAETYGGISVAATSRLAAVALIGPGTHGAAEVLAAALQRGTNRVVLVGRPTAGRPPVRDPIEVGGEWVVHVRRYGLNVCGAPMPEPVRPDIELPEGPPPDVARPERGNGWQLNPRRRESEEENVDRALSRRVQHDAALQRAVDLLIAIRALRLRP